MHQNPGHRFRLVALGFLIWPLLAIPAAQANTAAECTTNKFCYCVTTALKPAIDEKVAYFQGLIAAETAKGKAVGYMSIPLSTAGGAYFGFNRTLGVTIKERIEARFGSASSWVLNPTATDADLPRGASQGDYMFMWTRILEGAQGLGEGFHFVYFVGPNDIAAALSFNGAADMDKVDAVFDRLLQTDPGFKTQVENGRLNKLDFRNYYTLRASVAFSRGAHDEWNIFRVINERRRAHAEYGIPKQLPILFDGRGTEIAGYEQSIAPGNAGACP